MINPKGGRPAKEYSLSLDMVERSELGRQARRYFIESEKKLQTQIVKQLPPPKKSLKKEFSKYDISKIKNEFKNLIAFYMQQPIDNIEHVKYVLTLRDETTELLTK